MTVDVPQSHSKVDKLVREKVEHILERTGCEKLTVYLSEGKNFRFDRATIQPYKGNRRDFVKPYHWKTVGEYLREHYDVVTCTTFEADDHLAEAQDVVDYTTVIASRDKDLRIKSGWHYSWQVGERSPEKPLYCISDLEGIRWFYTQMLIGDSTDNIRGCAIKAPTKTGKLRRKGVGAKEAEALLFSAVSEEEMFAIVAGQYKKHIGDDWEAQLLENGCLLWMCDQLTSWEELEKTQELLRKYNEEANY